jgi:hypothetical protein
MPIFKNQGRYGELGHWGKKHRTIPKKKIILVLTLLVLGTIFAVSRNGIIPIVNAGDYNSSYSHTRTNIFNDQNFNGPVIAPSTVVFKTITTFDCSVNAACSHSVTVAIGDLIAFSILMTAQGCVGANAVPSDTQSNAYTMEVSAISGANGCNAGTAYNAVEQFTAVASASGAETIGISTYPFNVMNRISVFSGVVSVGTTVTTQLGAGVGTTTVTTPSTPGGIVYETSFADSATTTTYNTGQTNVCTGLCQGDSGGEVAVAYNNAATILNSITFAASAGIHDSVHTGTILVGQSAPPPDFSQVRWNYNSTCVLLSGPSSPTAQFDYSIGNNVGQSSTLDSFHPTPPTSMYNSDNGTSSFFGQTFTISGSVNWQIGSVQFLMNQTASWTGAWVAQIWNIQGTAGVNAIPIGTGGNTNPSSVGTKGFPIGSSLYTSTPFTGPLNSTASPVTFTFQNGGILSPGNYMVSLTTNSSIVSTAQFLTGNSIGGKLVSTLFGDGSPAYAGHNVYLPRTGQLIRTTKAFWFTVTGLNTNLGINCNSADIMIMKASTNFQTASGRMLEMVQAWSQPTSQFLNATLVLRATNSTLPSFTENYNPFNDPEARLIWSVCPTTSKQCSPNGFEAVYVARDNSNSISQESKPNDLIINGTLPAWKTSVQIAMQTVLNFTGPNNFLFSTNSTISHNSASQFQMGESYYILVRANFNTTQVPNNNAMAMQGGITIGGSGNPSLGFWSVPASCNDPLNKVACGFGTPTPVFQFNPLDPSSWGNAIIQGLTWVFIVAVPQALLIVAGILLEGLRLTFNFIGNQLGWGNVGDNIVAFFTGLGPLFVSIGLVLQTTGRLVANSVNSVAIFLLFTNPYFAGLKNFLNDVSNAAGSGIIVNMILEIAFWFPTSYMIILITFYFLLVLMNGLKGFFEWVHIVKWSAFHLFNILAEALQIFIKFITAILGRLSVISPGHEFPKIPTVDSGPLPKISLGFGNMALFHDPTAWFLGALGFFFTFMWAGTTSAGLPGASQSIIGSMQSLTLTIFGISFMVLILYIPGWLIGKMYENGILSD